MEAPRSREMAGRAVLTTAESRNTIKTPRPVTASTHQRLEFGLARSTVPASSVGGPSAGRTLCSEVLSDSSPTLPPCILISPEDEIDFVGGQTLALSLDHGNCLIVTSVTTSSF